VSSPLEQLEPWLRPYAEQLFYYLDLYFPGEVTITNVYRSPSKQLELWNNRANNPYPVAPPGTSYHEFRRAWDMVGPPEVLAWAGQVWESWGGTWGGRFGHSDPIHFQA
jgi:hypothetical protein